MSATAAAEPVDWTGLVSTVVDSRVRTGTSCLDCNGSASSIDLVCPAGHPLREPPGLLTETRLWVISGTRTLAGVVALALAFDLAWPAYLFGCALFFILFAMILKEHTGSRIWFVSHALAVSSLVGVLSFVDFGDAAALVRLSALTGVLATIVLGSLLFVWLERAQEKWYVRGLAVNALLLLLCVSALAGAYLVEATGDVSVPWGLLALASSSVSLGLLGGVALVGIASIGSIQAGEFHDLWATSPTANQRRYPSLSGPQEPERFEAGQPGRGFRSQIAYQIRRIRVTILNFFVQFIYQTRVVLKNGINESLRRICQAIDYTRGVVLRFFDRLRRSAIMAYRTALATLGSASVSTLRFARLVLMPVALLSGTFILLAVASLGLLEYVRIDDWTIGVGGLKVGFEMSVLRWGAVSIFSALVAFMLGCAVVGCLLRENPWAVLLSAVSGTSRYMTEAYLLFLVIAYGLWLGGAFVPSSPYSFGPAMALATMSLIAILATGGRGKARAP